MDSITEHQKINLYFLYNETSYRNESSYPTEAPFQAKKIGYTRLAQTITWHARTHLDDASLWNTVLFGAEEEFSHLQETYVQGG